MEPHKEEPLRIATLRRNYLRTLNREDNPLLRAPRKNMAQKRVFDNAPKYRINLNKAYFSKMLAPTSHPFSCGELKDVPEEEEEAYLKAIPPTQ